jgi:hypothetical protein
VASTARASGAGGVRCWRTAVAAPPGAVGQGWRRPRRQTRAACQLACLQGAAQAGKGRIRGRRGRARGLGVPRRARRGGQRAAWRPLRRMRPSRAPHVGASGVGVSEAHGRARVPDGHLRALGQRRGATVSPGAVGPSGAGPWGIKRCRASRGRGACDGGSPWGGAFCRASRLRAVTMAAGPRARLRRAATRAFAPQANRGRAARPVPRRAPVGEDQGVPRAVPRGHAPRLRREPPEPRGASRRPGGARWALALASRPEPSGAWGGACHPVVPRGLVWTVPGGQSPRSPPTAGIVPAGLHGGPRGGGPAP